MKRLFIIAILVIAATTLMSSCGADLGASSSVVNSAQSVDNGSSSSAPAPSLRYTVHYSSSWNSVNIHYNIGGVWTTAPGAAMTSEGGGWWVYQVTSLANTALTFVFNNSTTWDNNGGLNYNTTNQEIWVIGGLIFTNSPTNQNYTLTLHYKPAALSSPVWHAWNSGAPTGVEISPLSNDSFGAVYQYTTNVGINLGIRFHDGTAWEPDGLDRYAGYLMTNREYWIAGEFQYLFGSDPTAILLDPADPAYTNQLGANKDIDGVNVNFAFFEPRTTNVGITVKNGSRVPMHLTTDGRFWWYRTNAVAGDVYNFSVDGTLIPDPYARANKYSWNGGSYIVDPSFSFASFTIPSKTKMVLYEMHVYDMTGSDTNVPAAIRGKYLGLTNKIPYLKNLGVNAVEIMPMQEFPGAGYSWGYNNALYFSPECDYATGYAGQQVSEFQTTVDEFHKAGIAVILDVVYNHTANSDNVLWTVDGDYYFDPAGTPWGNKFYIQRPMATRFIQDNLRMWMRDYNVDGFRFDGVYVMDKPTLYAIITNLKAEGFTNQIYIAELFGDSFFKGKDVPTWNSTFRDSVKSAIKTGTSGVGGAGLGDAFYFNNSKGYFDVPAESISYLESHDEETMGSAFGANALGVQKGKLAATFLFTCLGFPMMYEGQEFHRVKGSQDTSQANNVLNWNLLTTNTNHYNYFSGLIRLRTTEPAFRADTSTFVSWAEMNWNSQVLSYFRSDGTNYYLIAMNFNSTTQNRSISNFPANGTWKLIADMSTVDTNGTGPTVAVSSSNATITIPAWSGLIWKY